MKTFTVEEVAKHNTAESCWIIIDGQVYDVTKFLAEHPGGKKVLMNVGGKDASKQFVMFHKPGLLQKYQGSLLIGKVGEAAAPQPAAPAYKSPEATIDMFGAKVNVFGDLVPYGDPSWYQGRPSPYFKESHKKVRAAMREWVEREIMPFVHEWDEAKSLPKDLWRKAAAAGILPAIVASKWPVEYVGTKIIGDIPPEEFDGFHAYIILDELARCGSGGVLWGLCGGLGIGLPPIMHFGSDFLKNKVCSPCLKGEKFICLAVTEPAAGSDVANLTTTAVKSPCGKYYVVNGEKKWITNGVFCDYFTVAVRTGKPGSGMKGVSMLLIERSFPGVTTRQMNCSGVWASGTTYITFEDVKVPVENLIGKENQGFKYVMHNFNGERIGMSVQATRLSRVMLEESIKYAEKRVTFGKKLIQHPVIRNKIANMVRQVEGLQALLESVIYQAMSLPHEAAMLTLGGPVALLKAHSGVVMEFCARESAQIFGGLSYTRGGQGEKVERLYREVRAYAIPAGSEEIMLDLGVRQALKIGEMVKGLAEAQYD